MSSPGNCAKRHSRFHFTSALARASACVLLAGFLAGILVLITTIPANAATPGVEVFVACHGDIGKPSVICYPDSSEYDEPTFAVLRSSSDLEYDVCQTARSPNPPRCATNQRATAGAPSQVLLSFESGQHTVSWRLSASGAEIGSYEYSAEERGILFAAGASDQFTARLHRQLFGAFFPEAQRHSKSCPRVYARATGRIAVCFIEYVHSGEWHLLRGVENIPLDLNEIVVKTVSDQSWRRRAVRCPLPPRVPGKLVSNNGCGRAMPYSDAQLVTSQLLPNIHAGEPLDYLRWKPLFGPFTLSIFSGRHLGRWLRFNNEVGDWFAYMPMPR
jgi:hypothetical protein